MSKPNESKSPEGQGVPMTIAQCRLGDVISYEMSLIKGGSWTTITKKGVLTAKRVAHHLDNHFFIRVDHDLYQYVYMRADAIVTLYPPKETL